MSQEMLRAEVKMAEREVVEAKDAWAQAYENNPGDSIRLAQLTQRISVAEDALAALDTAVQLKCTAILNKSDATARFVFHADQPFGENTWYSAVVGVMICEGADLDMSRIRGGCDGRAAD